MNIVPTNIPYTYFLLKQNLATLKNIFPFINVFVVGKSVLGKNIYAIRLGYRAKKCLLLWFYSC